jgi:hypothetical protein
MVLENLLQPTLASPIPLERKHIKTQPTANQFNPLTPELNPSAQQCLTRFSTGDFAS